MSHYRMIVLALMICSILTGVFGMMGGSNKSMMAILYKLFGAITLILIFVIGYRAFLMVR